MVINYHIEWWLLSLSSRQSELVPIARIGALILAGIDFPGFGNWIEIGIAPWADVLSHGPLAVNAWPEVGILWRNRVFVASMAGTGNIVASAATAAAAPAATEKASAGAKAGTGWPAGCGRIGLDLLVRGHKTLG